MGMISHAQPSRGLHVSIILFLPVWQESDTAITDTAQSTDTSDSSNGDLVLTP